MLLTSIVLFPNQTGYIFGYKAVLMTYFTVPRGCLQFVIVVFPDHTHNYFQPYE